MGRRPSTDPLVDCLAGPHRVQLPQSVIHSFYDASEFILSVVQGGRSLATAVTYCRLVANARRAGTINNPKAVQQPNTATAINAYWRWMTPKYERRLQTVIRALVAKGGDHPFLRENLARVRVGSLVPPKPSKHIPQTDFVATRKQFEEIGARIREAGPPQGTPERPSGGPALATGTTFRWDMGRREVQPAASVPAAPKPVVRWELCANSWTLHVPTHDAEPHNDPCEHCRPIVLDDELLHVVAAAFQDAWGPSCRPEDVPPEAYLFGLPPPKSELGKAVVAAPPRMKIAALAPVGTRLAIIAEQMKGVATERVQTFCERVQASPPDAIVIDFATVKTASDVRQLVDAIERMLLQARVHDEAVPTQDTEPAMPAFTGDAPVLFVVPPE